MESYESWWQKNVVNGKYYTVDQFKNILGAWDSRRVYPKLIPDNRRVLDVGCGLGLDYEFYIKNDIDIEYIGVDACHGFVEQNKKDYPLASFIWAKSYELPFGNKTFGLATSRHVLEHLKEPYSTIEEMCRVSDRVAIIWFIFPGRVQQIRLTRKGFYKNTYSKSELISGIKQFGFKTEIQDIRLSKSKSHQLWYLTR